MSIDPAGGFMSSFGMNDDFFTNAQAQQSQAAPPANDPYGAQTPDYGLVARTMDSLNGMPPQNDTATYASRQEFGAAVVAKTLDYMNSGGMGSGTKNNDYDFQKSVLEGAYSGGKGNLASFKV